MRRRAPLRPARMLRRSAQMWRALCASSAPPSLVAVRPDWRTFCYGRAREAHANERRTTKRLTSAALAVRADERRAPFRVVVASTISLQQQAGCGHSTSKIHLSRDAVPVAMQVVVKSAQNHSQDSQLLRKVQSKYCLRASIGREFKQGRNGSATGL